MKRILLILYLLIIFTVQAVIAGNYVFTVKGNKTYLNGQQILVAGLRCSNALISDESTNELINHLDEYKSFGINTISVFVMGSRYGNFKGYLEDASMNPIYRDRLGRIIEAADDRGMIVLVGCLYWGGSTAKWESWTQNEANTAIANTVKWLSDQNYRNIFVDVDNEGMGRRYAGFDNTELVRAAKAVDPSIFVATNFKGFPPDEADLGIHFSKKVKDKPYIDSEATPSNAPGGYWGKYSKAPPLENYINIGIYTPQMKANQIQSTKEHINADFGYMLASTWLQCVPPHGPNADSGGDGSEEDPGIRWWLEALKEMTGPYDPPPGNIFGYHEEINGILSAGQSGNNLPEVEEVDLSKIDPSYFSQEEWFIPYYLKHFASVANSVVDTGENRGFFNLSVWRGSHNHHAYNARVMEGILSLAWFYCNNRPWNIYYGDPALKKRIEASLQFWCKIQNTDGRFSEYGVGQWSLAPTAFATKFIGRALWLLAKQGSQIDEDIFEQARVSLRKALFIGFSHEGLWEHGRKYTNQYANLWGGALIYLDIWPDNELETLLKKRFKESMTEFQSPAGFFYEAGGPDWGYNLNTHHSDLQVAWEYADKELRDLIIKKTKNWYEWFSYNALKEPQNMCYYLNRAIETRQQKGYYYNNDIKDPAFQRWAPQAEFIPLARAFEMSDEEFSASNKKQYNEMLKMYPGVLPLIPGEFNAFTPYAFLHHNMKMWHPSQEQKKEAIEGLPYLKDSSFIKVMHDERSNTIYAFFRSPKYYATFNSGKIITDQQRYGIGLIWTPRLGTVFQSQSKTDEASWGTKAIDSVQVYEAGDLIIEKMIDQNGANKPFKSTTVRYKLGENGRKIISFDKNRIRVEVYHPGYFNEIMPLLISDDDLINVSGGQINIESHEGTFLIISSEKDGIEIKDFKTDLRNKNCKVIEISVKNRLIYDFVF